MGYLADGFAEALRLIIRMDPEVWGITLVSLKVSAASTLIATILGVPLGFSVASREFRGKGFVITVLNTLLALPTVVVGLSVYAFLSRRGPLGSLGLLFTPAAMVIGQSILALPITAALSLAAVQHIDPRVRETALTLGATAGQAARAVLREGRFAILAAVIAAFGRVFAEVGVSMMLGGNIRFYTRNIPTAIALETGRGEFPLAVALGLILLSVAFGVNLVFQRLQRR
ncbi:MAG: ABC transporter permease [Chlamydiota bacterium]